MSKLKIDIKAITSMDKTYYDKCGKVMLQSFKKHQSETFPLHCYNENGFLPKVKTIKSMGWNLGPEYTSFMGRTGNSKVRTFAKKAYSIIHSMNYLNCERIMWLDADTIMRRGLPAQLLELIAPDDVLSTHFGVWHEANNKKYFSCETGFFILNKNHKMFSDFRDLYSKIYNESLDSDLRRFYDGEVYGKTVSVMEKAGAKMIDLNPGKHKTPISRSILAPYLTHFKAGLKDRVDFDQFKDEFDDDILFKDDEEI